MQFRLSDIFGFALGIASAIKVFGYTWSALKDEYQPFGSLTGGAGVPGPDTPLPKGNPASNPGFSGGTKAKGLPGADWTFDPGLGLPSGKGVKTPPGTFVYPLIKALQQNNHAEASKWWGQLNHWANHAPGWKDSVKRGSPPMNNALQVWIYSQPWASHFRKMFPHLNPVAG